MKTRMLVILAGLGLTALLVSPAAAIRAIDDFRASDTVRDTVGERNMGEVSAASAQETRTQEVEQIQELLRLDELNRENTMREALRQENLNERVQGRADLEMAMEEQNVDLHLGKVLTDVHGNRVRMEEYVLRPEANQVQFVNLTMRDNRLDYINYNAYFNDILPRDTRGLWRKEFGKTAPDIYLVKETSEVSNLTDAVAFQVDFFAPTWETASQRYILPERESSIRVNTILKWGQTRNTPADNFAAMPDAVGVKENYTTYTEGNYLAPRWHLTFMDDTFLEMQSYLITENGDIVPLRNFSDLINIFQNLSEFVFNSYKEQIWTASEFEDRTIDTVSQFEHLVNIFADDDRGWR
jgi:hypothetical protein